MIRQLTSLFTYYLAVASVQHSRPVPAEKRRGRDIELGPGEWAVLALLTEKPRHGWALANELAVETDLGAVWTFTRPHVYLSIDRLVARGLIVRAGFERGQRGPNRTIFQPTPAGRRAMAGWLREPVERVGDARPLLLLKLLLSARIGLDDLPLLEAQHRLYAEAAESLTAGPPPSSSARAILARFQLESTLGLLCFIERLLESRSLV
jgi:DNA-binding PadR family transcriptional regulator